MTLPDPTLYQDRNLSEQAAILSVVVPCYNEEMVIAETQVRLVRILDQISDIDFEIVYVDDGSRDKTAAVISSFCASDPRIKLVRLSRNFGQQIAVSAGLAHISGDAVVLTDGDLQDPPELIPQMLQEWRKGYDIVYAVRSHRKGENFLKLWGIKAFATLLNKFAEVPMPANTGDFRLMDRQVVDAVLTMPERRRLIRSMVAWVGFRHTGIPYEREPRYAGKSKNSFSKLLSMALDGIASTSFVPLKMITWMGITSLMISMIGITYTLLRYMTTGTWLSQWVMVSIFVVLATGVQLVSLGLVGEYISRLYDESKQRPLYIVREKIGFGCNDDSANKIAVMSNNR